MKNLKKTIFGLLALVMVFGLVFTVSAFKGAKKTQKQWFVYTGNDAAGESQQQNYEPFDGGEPTSCGTGDMRCAIYADPVDLGGGEIRPDLSSVDHLVTKYQPEP